MKFIIILFILFESSTELETYKFRYENFDNKKICNDILNKQKDFLNETVILQFSNKNIKEYNFICMTQDKYNEILQKQIIGA